MKVQKLLSIILVLQIITILNQWFGGPVTKVQAQIPDSGAQLNQIVDQLKSSNDTQKEIDDKLDKMLSLFQSGKLQVEVAKPDDNSGK